MLFYCVSVARGCRVYPSRSTILYAIVETTVLSRLLHDVWYINNIPWRMFLPLRCKVSTFRGSVGRFVMVDDQLMQEDFARYLHRLQSYCAFRERCTQEVRQKMERMGVPDQWRVELLRRLRMEGYVDDARFAEVFARSRFRYHRWGRRKIALALRQKEISRALIRAALAEIDEGEYRGVLEELARAHLDDVASPEAVQRTYRYLYQKGYEPELIRAVLVELQQGGLTPTL